MSQYDKHRNQDEHDSRDHDRESRSEQQRPRRNPRLVIGSLDFFDMLMEQDEQG